MAGLLDFGARIASYLGFDLFILYVYPEPVVSVQTWMVETEKKSFVAIVLSEYLVFELC